MLYGIDCAFQRDRATAGGNDSDGKRLTDDVAAERRRHSVGCAKTCNITCVHIRQMSTGSKNFFTDTLCQKKISKKYSTTF